MTNAELLTVRGATIRDLPKVITERGIAASGDGGGAKFKEAIYTRDIGYFGLQVLEKPQNGELKSILSAIENSLITTAEFQGKEFDDRTGQQPGEFPHECFGAMSNQEMLTRIKNSGGPVKEVDGHLEMVTWWALDATPLWICLFADYIRVTGNDYLKRRLWGNFEAGLAWMYEYGDEDRDGLIEGGSVGPHGPKNQWWKDSENSLIDEEGKFPTLPIAPLDVNSFAFLAEVKAAELYLSEEKTGKAQDLLKKAKERQELINKLFWVEDLETISPALDSSKAPIRIITSDGVIALWAGVLEKEKALKVIGRNLEEDLLTDFGLRTRSRLSKQYNPNDYQNGNVWPHLALIAAAGCEKLGLAAEAEKFEAPLPRIAQRGFEELLVVDDEGNPHPYLEDEKPAACFPQTLSLGGALNRTACIII